MDTCFVTISHKYNKLFFNKVRDIGKLHGGIWQQNYSATAIPKINLEMFMNSLDLVSREYSMEIDVSVNGIAHNIGYSVRKVYVALSFPFNRQLLQKIQSIRQSEFLEAVWHPDYKAYYIAVSDAEKFIAKSASAAALEGIELKSRIIDSFRDFEVCFDKFDRLLINSINLIRHEIFGASFDCISKVHRIPSDSSHEYIEIIKYLSAEKGIGILIREVF